ncbi:MAG TPA: phospholipase D-like domain-containing protein [Planktothrix sp.]|jgi:phosphatidylserine/phosphatidylglycerophosphate/cardiolipin synthase-like enzyme
MLTSQTVARAYASSNVALLAVKTPKKIPNFAGWAIKRKNVSTGTETWLNSQVPFKGQTNPDWQARSTTEWPIQKPVWKDFQAPQNEKLVWGFCPVYFDATQKTAVRCDTNDVTWTNEIVLTPDVDDEISIAFNNGFLSTQWLAHQVPKTASGEFDFKTLLGWLSTPKNAIRVHQAGDVLPLLMSAIQQARAEGGHAYLVLYEFTDPELVDLVAANHDVVTIILGNAPTNDEENKPTRDKLKAAGVKVIDRFVGSEEIPHNKLVIYADKTGAMCYIISGSTNWTVTGLCCQSNTSIRVKNKDLAKLYKKAFDLLTQDAGMKPTQSAWLRSRFAKKPPIVTLKSGARVQVFFTPNTKDRTKPKTAHPLPVDRAFGSNLFRNTEEALTSLFFIPGNPSYLDDIRWLSENKLDMSLLEVAVSSPTAMQKGDVLLQHRPGQPSVGVVASAIEKAFGVFVTEILKLPDAFAIIHTKAAQGDARHKNRWKVWCMLGSHNGGDKASFQNDEQVLFIIGHRGVSIAMMVNHMDVCDHYRFRAMVNQNSNNDTLLGFLSQDDSWQDKYFVAGAALKELDYLTRDDEQEEDGPIPDFLASDPDPNAFDNWGNEGVEWEAEAAAAEKAEQAGAITTTPEPKGKGGEHKAPPKGSAKTGETATKGAPKKTVGARICAKVRSVVSRVTKSK